MAQIVSTESALSEGGIVKLRSATGTEWSFFVEKMSVPENINLGNELSAEYKRTFGPGGYFQKMKGVLDWMKETKATAEFSLTCNKLTEMEATGELPSEQSTFPFRQSPLGVAIELFRRTRRTHEEVKFEELRASITSMNALEIHNQIYAAISDDNKST